VTTARSTLIVTNDFPPRQGGIQAFVHEIALRLPRDSVVVYASTFDGAAAFDAEQPFPVVRHGSGLLIPTPDARRRIRATLREYGSTSVWFGASAPLGLLAADLRAAGAERIVATTHGHEIGWARLPVARRALRRIGETCDVVTYLGEYTRHRIAGALGPHARLEQLTPGVDVTAFRPDVDGSAVRVRYGLGERPVIVCVSRLVPRKGQDTLIHALALIRREVRDAALLIVGRGPDDDRLRRLARETGLDRHVVVTGGVPGPDLPQYYAAGDVFAMPCRTRRGGLDVEGLGIVYLEASATGLPVVAGNSGGAPEAVRPGETGYVVDGRDVEQVARQLVALLTDRQLSSRLGAAGRAWVERDWTWQHVADRLAGWLAPPTEP
jgi:phosphatidylinositol alpha-1,6-mannosyltransferase